MASWSATSGLLTSTWKLAGKSRGSSRKMFPAFAVASMVCPDIVPSQLFCITISPDSVSMLTRPANCSPVIPPFFVQPKISPLILLRERSPLLEKRSRFPFKNFTRMSPLKVLSCVSPLPFIKATSPSRVCTEIVRP